MSSTFLRDMAFVYLAQETDCGDIARLVGAKPTATRKERDRGTLVSRVTVARGNNSRMAEEVPQAD